MIWGAFIGAAYEGDAISRERRMKAQAHKEIAQMQSGDMQADRVTLRLPYPISANRYWATRVIPAKPPERKRAIANTYVTDEAKAYKQQARWMAVAAGIRQPIEGRIAVEIHLYPHRPQDWAKRAQKDPDGWADTVQCIDLGNCEKVLSDALNGIAWHDDKQLHDIHLKRFDPDELGARVEVIITPIRRPSIAPELPLCGPST